MNCLGDQRRHCAPVSEGYRIRSDESSEAFQCDTDLTKEDGVLKLCCIRNRKLLVRKERTTILSAVAQSLSSEIDEDVVVGTFEFADDPRVDVLDTLRL